MGLRVEPEVVSELQRLARAMSARSGGVKVTHQEAARVLLLRALPAALREFGGEDASAHAEEHEHR